MDFSMATVAGLACRPRSTRRSVLGHSRKILVMMGNACGGRAVPLRLGDAKHKAPPPTERFQMAEPDRLANILESLRIPR
jgi:hypothetical protein